MFNCRCHQRPNIETGSFSAKTFLAARLLIKYRRFRKASFITIVSINL